MSRPFVIWVSVVVSGVYALSAAWGLLGDFLMLPRWLQTIGMARAGIVIVIQAALTAFLVAVVYSGLARPRWGHVVCGLFAVLFVCLLAYKALQPDLHPLFAIKPGAEEAGAFAGRWTVVALFLVHAYHMVLGAKARDYFALKARAGR